MIARASRARVPWCRHGALAAAAILTLAIAVAGCGLGRDTDDEEEKPVSAPPRVTSERGETRVTLDAGALSRSGIAVEALAAVTHAASLTAHGSVLDLSELAAARGAVAAAGARLEKGRAALSASQAELARVQALYTDQRNASQKDLQAATARARADEAEVKAAEGELEAQKAGARQRWGAVIAGWLDQTSPQLEALLQQKQRLLEVALPPGNPSPAPGTAVTVQTGGGAAVAARVVSQAPRADPRIQGASVLCTAPASPEMLPGIAVAAAVPGGPPVPGVLVPASAVVWWQGRAWVYEQAGEGSFIRREIVTDAPVPGGFFVATGIAPGARVVVRGAQVLLSEEGRGAVHGSEG